MASSYSALKIELMVTGEQSNTWGDVTNLNLGTALEEAIVGRATANFPTDANLTLTLIDTNASQVARNYVLNVTSSGSLTATRSLIVPSIEKPYLIENNTTGGQSILVKTLAGTGITVPNGKSALVYTNGVNVVSSLSYVPDLVVSGTITGNLTGNVTGTATGLSTTLAVASGGTGVTTSTGTGSVVLSNSPTLVTPILGTPASGTLTNCTGYTYANLSGAVPTWNQNTTGTAAGLSTTLAVASGGTGVTTSTGTGSVVLSNSPTLVTPVLGTPASGTLTNCTGYTYANLSGAVPTWNQNTTGNAATATTATNIASGAAGQIPYNTGSGATSFTAAGTAGQILQSNGTSAPTWGSSIVSMTAQATTSGTAKDFTGIPSWVKRITVIFNGVSSTGNNTLSVQLGTSSGIETTGYDSLVASDRGSEYRSSTNLIVAPSGSTTNTTTISGAMTILLVSGTTFVSSTCCADVDGTNERSLTGGGNKTLASALTQLRVLSTVAFDAGSVNVMYE